MLKGRERVWTRRCCLFLILWLLLHWIARVYLEELNFIFFLELWIHYATKSFNGVTESICRKVQSITNSASLYEPLHCIAIKEKSKEDYIWIVMAFFYFLHILYWFMIQDKTTVLILHLSTFYHTYIVSFLKVSFSLWKTGFVFYIFNYIKNSIMAIS